MAVGMGGELNIALDFIHLGKVFRHVRIQDTFYHHFPNRPCLIIGHTYKDVHIGILVTAIQYPKGRCCVEILQHTRIVVCERYITMGIDLKQVILAGVSDVVYDSKFRTQYNTE